MKTGIWKYMLVFMMTVASGAALMVVSHKVQRAEVEISRLEGLVSQEHETIRLLEAEWAYLNNPQRLDEIATQYLGLVPALPESLASDFSVLQPVPETESEEIQEGDADQQKDARAVPVVMPEVKSVVLVDEPKVSGVATFSVASEVGGGQR